MSLRLETVHQYKLTLTETLTVYMYISILILYEYADGYTLVEVDLGQVYNDIDSPEALKAAMKDFYDNKVPAFKKGEKPAEITRDEQIEESKKPLNESAEFEELIDNITTWPWHYAEIPDDMYQEMVDDLTAYGTPQRFRGGFRLSFN